METGKYTETVRFATKDLVEKSDVLLRHWLWPNVLAEGALTVLTSPWKVGKSTLISHLIAESAKTQGEIAGIPVDRFNIAILTEEDITSWQERNRILKFGNNVSFHNNPDKHMPEADQWKRTIKEVIKVGTSLIVIDPVARFLPPGSESNPKLIMEFLQLFQFSLSMCKCAVLLVTHPSKNTLSSSDLNPRGCGILASSADILVQYSRLPGASIQDRRRQLVTCSRFEGPKSFVLELSKDGRKYVMVKDGEPGDMFWSIWPTLKQIITDCMLNEIEATLACIHSVWPVDQAKPSYYQLYRWTREAIQCKLLFRTKNQVGSLVFRFVKDDDNPKPKPIVFSREAAVLVYGEDRADKVIEECNAKRLEEENKKWKDADEV